MPCAKRRILHIAAVLLLGLVGACAPAPARPDDRLALTATPSPGPTSTLPAAPIELAPTPLAQAMLGEGVTVALNAVDVNARRAHLDYTLRHVPPSDPGQPPSPCPLRMTLLRDQHGYRYGNDGIVLSCSRTGEGTYRVVEELRHKWRFDLGDQLDLTLHLLVDPQAHALPDGSVSLPARASEPASVLDAVIDLNELREDEGLRFRTTVRGEVTLTEAQRVEANGLAAELRGVEMSRRQLSAEICLDLPDDRIWHPTDVRLSQDRPLTGAFNWSLTGDAFPQTARASQRCFRFLFKLEPANIVPSRPMTLTLEGLALQPGQGDLPPPATCEEALQRLAARDPRIRARCPGAGGGSLPDILEPPAGMSRDEAFRIALEAYYQIEFIRGPWTFSIPPLQVGAAN